TDNFNVTYFLIQLFGTFFTFMAWQGNQGYYGAAKTPHDARMGRVIGSYRVVVQGLPLVLLPIWAYTFYHHPAYAAKAAEATAVLATTGSAQLQTQLAVTVALPHLLPIGLMGCFAAIMLAAFVTTHDTYLHSWGSIFVQDVVLPIRSSLFGAKATLSPEKHLLWLRLSITGVAVFIFLFSLLFNQQQDILMYFALTGTIYLGWAGAAIVGGLYWKRGTTAGAWTAAVLGMVLAVVGWYMTYFWPSFQSIAGQLTPGLWDAACGGWAALAGDKCPITAQVLWFYTMLASALGYIVVSLCTQPKKAYDVDRLLHRGKHIGASGKEQYDEDVPTGLRALAMGKEYTFGDKCIVVFSYAYSLVFFAIFLFGTLYAMKYTVTDATWLTIWRGYGWLMLVLMILITTWMAVGGCRDLVALFRELGSMRRDERDDGSVIGHLNFDETEKDGHE
ncbi:MAG: hypothetical protein QG656_1397, partial [Candidatus Hydrogenedentes bacterium]|nr:hypothetical protein [Candidatus Hydrogenedentota bacterium]